MSTPARKFVVDPSSPSQLLANRLAEADATLLAELVRLRDELGLKQQDVADALGISQPTVAGFERMGNDPRMSTVRRYAHAIGVEIAHRVKVDEARWGSAVASRPNCEVSPVVRWDQHSTPMQAGAGRVVSYHVGAPISYLDDRDRRQMAADSKRTDFALGA